jgi:hypothetical protein
MVKAMGMQRVLSLCNIWRMKLPGWPDMVHWLAFSVPTMMRPL